MQQSNGKYSLLSEGIEALRQSDKDIESLIAHRAEEVTSQLIRYINEIELFNAAYGLVGAADTEELIIKHILDSLAPLGIISRLVTELCMADNAPAANGAAAAIKAADAGSGAGLPGIPLAITLPNFDFTLIERMGRRAGFLLNTKASLASLGLSNIVVEERELEKTAPESFHLVTFRAFKPLDSKLLKTLFKACAKPGFIAAYKGRREKIEQEMSPLADCGKWEAIPYTVPFLNEERHLLVIKTP
ncbi:MAG: class I SAM-dependent methyltransferase [Treponema sp.]|jgi:16S rRNA (guanine527-N7)-methyltransferase|nr:class I SAM-dependent methyltransferase [Treponema sp.]